MEQAFPGFLVHRGSDGVIQWMEISEPLRALTENGTKTIRQFEFKGERFDVMSVRREREKHL